MKTLNFKTIITIIFAFTLVFILSTSVVQASSTVTLSVSDVTTQSGEDVAVPVVLSGNTGIIGLQFSVSYSNELVLKSVAKGNAIPTATFTAPGDLTANPIAITFDGQDADSTNGTVVTLTFTVPENTTGDFEISLLNPYTFDNDFNDIFPDVVNGKIVVEGGTSEEAEPSINVSNYNKSGNSVTFDVNTVSESVLSGKIIAAIYGDGDRVLTAELYSVSETVPVSLDANKGKYIKVFWWDVQNLSPISSCVKFYIN